MGGRLVPRQNWMMRHQTRGGVEEVCVGYLRMGTYVFVQVYIK